MTNNNSQSLLAKIFSSSSFQHLENSPFLKWIHISSFLRANNAAAKLKEGYVPQTSLEISSIPPEGILITNAGRYQFTQDITWNPTNPGSAILVLANEVVIDLNGHTLTINAPTPNTGQQFNGIQFGFSDDDLSFCTALTLQNGTINGASYYGICAIQTKYLQINNMTIGNMAYTETSKANLTACGIFIDSTESFNVVNCTVQNIQVTAPSCAGIQIIKSKNGTVSDCTMQEFLNNDGGVQGYSYLESEKITTNNCVSQFFRSYNQGLTQTTGHTVIGYVPIGCVSLVFNDCSADSMTGCCDDCHGMSVFLDMYVEVNNFRASNVTDGDCSVNTGAKATGLEVYGDYVTLNNCVSENILAIVPQDLQSAGFSVWGSNNTFNNCKAINVQVLNANRQPDTTFGYGTGFGWAPDPRPEFNATPAHLTQYNNCTSHQCQLGFDTWYHTQSIWKDVMAYACEIFILAQSDTTTRTLSMNRCSEDPNPLPDGAFHHVTLTNIAADNDFPEFVH